MAFIRRHVCPALLAGPRGSWLKARSCALHHLHRLQVDPRPVSPTFFSDRSEAITPELSIRLVAGLRKIGMLDAQGYVTADPRYTTQVGAATAAGCCTCGNASNGGWRQSCASEHSERQVAHVCSACDCLPTTLQPWKQQLAQLVPELSLETKEHEGPAPKSAIIGGKWSTAGCILAFSACCCLQLCPLHALPS